MVDRRLPQLIMGTLHGKVVADRKSLYFQDGFPREGYLSVT